MKKTMAMLLAMALCIGLAACAAATPGPTESPSTPTTAPTASPTDPTNPTEPTDPTVPPTDGALTGTVYTKTEPGAVQEGYYLLCGTSKTALEDGSSEAFISGLFDSKGTRLTTATLQTKGDQAATEDKNLVWQFISAGGGFYVKNAGTGEYLYHTGEKVNAIYATADQSEAGVWKIVSHDEVWTLEELSSGRQISLNVFGSEGSRYLGAAAYTANGSTARSLSFYELTSGTVTPNDPVTDPEPTEKPTEQPTEPTQKPTEAPEDPTTGSTGEVTYVLNTETKKIHKPTCRYADNKNRQETNKSKAELEAEGYEACKVCKP